MTKRRRLTRNQQLAALAIWAILTAFGWITQRELPAPDVRPTPSPTVAADRRADIVPGFVRVVAVVDGDTIKVDTGNGTETLRLIGMDTPETVDPRKPVQCFGPEASARAKELLETTEVRLEADPSQGERDKYDRLLRYVYLADGTSYNQLMIAEGYAHEYTYDKPYRYQSEFKAAEEEARASGKGFWSATTCAGNTGTASAE